MRGKVGRAPAAKTATPAPPRLIAAIDTHHGGRVARALRLIDQAAEAGAAAVKFSMRRLTDTYAAEVLEAPWHVAPETALRTGDVWRRLQLSPGDLKQARMRARARRVDFIVAPHDERDVATAAWLSPDAYQFDPASLGNDRVLAAIVKARRPVYVVAAMCTESMLRNTVRGLKGCDVVVLHAVTAPALTPGQLRLGAIHGLARRLGHAAGYLSFEPGTRWALVAAALGAVAIEKPFTLDASAGDALPGAVGPEELRQLARDLAVLPLATASMPRRVVLAAELDVLAATQCSLVARRPLRKGAELKDADLAFASPVRGISARLRSWAIGRRLLYDVAAGEPITFGLIEAQ